MSVMSETSVIDWLLDADPAIRWQVMRDLQHAPADAVAAERAKVAREGWGAELLALQRDDGSWGGGALFPEFTGTTPTLVLLHDMGVDPASDVAQAAIAKVAANVRWEHAGQRYFDGEVEPCINGKAVMIGAYFGVDVGPIVERLLSEQLDDGGWNCEVENAAVVSSFGTTMEVLDGLLEYERALGGNGAVAAARSSGAVRAARR